jgi:cyclase
MPRPFSKPKFSLSVPSSSIACAALFILTSALFAQSNNVNNANDVVHKAIAQFEQAPLHGSSLGDGIYLFSGDGGNVVAVADNGSTLLIDSGIASRATELSDAIYKTIHRPVTRLINTHWRFDHTGGNTFFGSSGVMIIAQANVKTRLSSEQDVPFIDLHDGPYPQEALPSLTFADHLELQQGSQQVRLIHFGAAHTDGDTVIFLEPANIVVLGDVFSQPSYPIIDLPSGGSLQGIIDSVDQVLSATNEQTQFIPGHGSVTTRADLQTYRDMLATMQDRITSLVRSGKTIDEAVAAAPTKDFDAKWGTGYVDGKVFTEMAYASIAKH